MLIPLCLLEEGSKDWRLESSYLGLLQVASGACSERNIKIEKWFRAGWNKSPGSCLLGGAQLCQCSLERCTPGSGIPLATSSGMPSLPPAARSSQRMGSTSCAPRLKWCLVLKTRCAWFFTDVSRPPCLIHCGSRIIPLVWTRSTQ